MNRAILVVTAGLVAASCSAPDPPAAEREGDLVPVIRVLDGDSLLVAIDGTEREVRLLGINTPERDECYAEAGRSRAASLAGDRVRLAGYGEDRFGRLLGYVYAEDGTLINERLISEGLALALTGDHALVSEFKARETEAFRLRIGRWQTNACGPAATASVEIDTVIYDAPGNDAQNSNGEWVDLVNTGAETVALDGWMVRDESSSHRFDFPDGFTLGPGARVRISSGCGMPSDTHLFWCDGDPVWSNAGDTAYLLDPAGNVADRWAF